MKSKLLCLICLMSLTLCQSFAVESSSITGDRIPLKDGELTTRQKVITVPANTEMPIMTTYELNSNALLTGQTVSVAIPVDYVYNNVLVAPKGSVVTGSVIEAKKARQNGTDGKLNVRFFLITTPYGLQIPIAASIKTSDLTGVLSGNSQKQKEEAMTLVKNRTLKNNEFEETLLKSILNFGENVVVPANTNLNVVLTQPITITPIEVSN